jgi:hypothetical protein
MVSGTSFISNKIKEQRFLRKYHQKHTLWIRDPRSGIKVHPESGSRWGKKHRIPDPEGMFFGDIFLRILVLLPLLCRSRQQKIC